MGTDLLREPMAARMSFCSRMLNNSLSPFGAPEASDMMAGVGW